ncbi:MAG: ATP synthase subunit I [Cyanobacteria bacterium J06634_5]
MTSVRKSIGTVQLFQDDVAIAQALDADAAQKADQQAMQASNQTPETEATQEQPQEGQVPLLEIPASETAMQDYYQLQQTLLVLTVIFGTVIFPCVWWAYSLATAISYLIGACTGIVYLRMLARSVGRIGRTAPKSNSGRLAILIGVLIVATQRQELSVLPVFLGFLTYKASLIAFVLWTSILPPKEAA